MENWDIQIIYTKIVTFDDFILRHNKIRSHQSLHDENRGVKTSKEIFSYRI
jgi:hypothetical protein